MISYRRSETEKARRYAQDGITFIDTMLVLSMLGVFLCIVIPAAMRNAKPKTPESGGVAMMAEIEPPLHIEPLSNGALYVWGEGTVLVRCGDPSDCIPELNAFFDKYRNCDIVGGIPYSGVPQGWLVEKGFIFFVRNPLGCPKVPECP